MVNKNIQLLIKDALAGKQSAYEALLKRYKNGIYSMIYQMIRNREETEDLVQETFIKAFNSLEKYNKNYAFSTWLYRITVNKCMDYLRKRKRKEHYEVELDKEEGLKLKGLAMNSADSGYQNTERQELQEIIQKVLNSLPEKYRVILVLREIEELSYQEIARVMKVSVSKVKVLLFRARQKIKEKLLPVYQEVI